MTSFIIFDKLVFYKKLRFKKHDKQDISELQFSYKNLIKGSPFTGN